MNILSMKHFCWFGDGTSDDGIRGRKRIRNSLFSELLTLTVTLRVCDGFTGKHCILLASN